MFSTRQRMTGLSGIDTESMVRQLMQAESLRFNALTKRNALTAYRQEAYRSVGVTIRAFESSVLSLNSKNSVRLPSNFDSKTVSVTSGGNAVSSNAVRASIGTDAKVGTHRLEVFSAAAKDRFESKEIRPTFVGEGEGLDFKWAEYGDGSDTSDLKFTVELDGVRRNITVTNAELKEIADTLSDPADRRDKVEEIINQRLTSAFGTLNGSHFGNDLNGKQKVEVSLKDNKFTLSSINGSTTNFDVGNMETLDILGLKAGQSGRAAIDLNSMKFNDLAKAGLTDGIDARILLNGQLIHFTVNTTVQEVMNDINRNVNGVTVSF